MPNITGILRRAVEVLQTGGVAEPRREANSLLAFALKKDKTFLIAHPEYELSKTETFEFQKFLARRANREPLQYIRGTQEFYGLNFVVTPAVLIPRSETELIVENAVEILREIESPRFCEVGVGSGCISISILHEIKQARAVAFDISESALKIARENTEKNNVAERLELRISNVFDVLKNERFDLIVSNPPYISSEEIKSLQVEVFGFEPHTALTDGADGFSIIEKIISDAPNFLQTNGFLLLEIGFNQSSKVAGMFDENIWQSLEFLPDLQGIPRTVKARKGKKRSGEFSFSSPRM